MRQRRVLTVLAALCLAGGWLAAKKKNPDETTQVLELPKDPPQVAAGEARRLVFHVSPLSGKGLLTQQTRDAIKALLKLNGGVPVVHLRAFVAGSGDIRRVPQIVSEVFTEKKLPLPSVSVLRAGGLGLENAQVVLEAVSQARRDANPGLDFAVGGETADLPKAVESLAAKLSGETALGVTCFVSSMANPAELSSKFPAAAATLVMTQRGSWQAFARCEAVARSAKPGAEKLAFTGTRVAFGDKEQDALLAFQRLDRDLTEAGAPPANIVLTNIYPLTGPVAEMARKLRPSAAPMSIVPFEGVASNDAGFAVDAVAAVAK